jgi:hypothetical protein
LKESPQAPRSIRSFVCSGKGGKQNDSGRIHEGAFQEDDVRSGIAKPGVPGLLKALEDPDPDVRKAAAQALKTIDPDAASKANAK